MFIIITDHTNFSGSDCAVDGAPNDLQLDEGVEGDALYGGRGQVTPGQDSDDQLKALIVGDSRLWVETAFENKIIPSYIFGEC